MTTALDVANFFIQSAAEDGVRDMTNLKLNKLLYYAQAISLQKYGKPLFDDPIQAWSLGPVVPHVYYEFNSNKEKPITEPSQPVSEQAFTAEEADPITDDYAAFAKSHQAWQLVDRTHQARTPWDQVHSSGSEPGKEIPVSMIQQYVDQHHVVDDQPQVTFPHEEVRPDSQGVLHIPASWDE